MDPPLACESVDARHSRRDKPSQDATSPVAEIIRLWKGEHSGLQNPPEERGPLTLLNLPVDILRLILFEVSRVVPSQPTLQRNLLVQVSSDAEGSLLPLLTVNSTLHNLVAPYIYSSFDIIWPEDIDAFSSVPDGVDSFTRGLTTFALSNRFARTIHRLQGRSSSRREVLRNTYAHFTRNFSISNGPARWTSDYTILTDEGKTLNTLVSLAVQKMINLESFKWDMPTGLTSDVFMALASLDDQPDDRPCKLEQIWVRWHDSRSESLSTPSSVFLDGHVPPTPPPPPPVPFPPDQPPSPPSSGPESIGSLNLNPPMLPRRRVAYSDSHAEYPTFSVLPPVKSLTALEVDQLQYLDEISILVERSKHILKELRLSIGAKAKDSDFVKLKGDQNNLRQVDRGARWPGESNIGDRRLGGVLGVVLGRVYDIRENWPRHVEGDMGSGSFPTQTTIAGPSTPAVPENVQDVDDVPIEMGSRTGEQADDSSRVSVQQGNAFGLSDNSQSHLRPARASEKKSQPGDELALERLELARIQIHTWLCVHAFDWTVLTSLTILQCPGQEKLWRALRERFQPTLVNVRPRRASSRQPPREVWQYHLKLKSLHVDVTTFSMMNFLGSTLAPNSLEDLFLHDRRRTTAPPVTFRQIFQTIKRQHSSLKRLLLDSAHADRIMSRADSRVPYWALSTEMIHYMASGKMESLRELSAVVESTDMVRTS